MATTTNNDASLLIRLPNELKAELMRAAAVNSRKVNTEVVDRLQKSRLLSAGYAVDNRPTLVHTKDNGPASPYSGLDQAMLEVFQRLTPEKQLALLSLLR